MLSAIYSFNFVDFMSTTDYFKRTISTTELGPIEIGREFDAEIPLTLHKCEFNDELLDPFSATSAHFEYITPVHSNEFKTSSQLIDLKDEDASVTLTRADAAVELYLSGYALVNQRVRYSFWELLGDVGGFHDGLFLVVAIVYAPFSAFAFTLDFVRGSAVDGGDNRKDRMLRQSERYRDVTALI